MYGIIYVITNQVTQKRYVGQTTLDDPQVRIREHFNFARQGFRHPLYDSIRKHGAASFSSEIIWGCPNQVLLDTCEVSFIRLFDSQHPNGYNLREGGRGGKHAAVSKLKTKISNTKIWEDPEKRRQHSELISEVINRPEIKIRHAAGLRISNMKLETIANRSAAMLITQNDPHVAAKKSKSIQAAFARPEVKEKQRLARLAAWADPEMRAKYLASSQTPEKRAARGKAISAALQRKKLKKLLLEEG